MPILNYCQKCGITIPHYTNLCHRCTTLLRQQAQQSSKSFWNQTLSGLPIGYGGQQKGTTMYIHYEVMNISGIEIIRLAFSSSPANVHVAGNIDFDLVKKMTTFIKQIPPTDREQIKHSTGAWTWAFPKAKYDTLRDMWKAANWITDTTCIEHPVGMLDLFIQHGRGYGKKAPKQRFDGSWDNDYESIEDASKEAPKAEDFFYNNAQPVAGSEMPLTVVKKQLEEMLDSAIDLKAMSPIELKKMYRKAAMKYHPDRNNGDGTKMSQLNYLYQYYISAGGL